VRQGAKSKGATVTTEERTPSYRDATLHKLMRELRAAVRTTPAAKAALAKVEQRLRYDLKVIDLWDKTHAGRAELFISLGDIPKANTAASLVFDLDRRQALLQRCFIGLDQHDRIEEAKALGREVLA
jgi:hypothetical protein